MELKSLLAYGIFIIGNLGYIFKPQKSSDDYEPSTICYSVVLEEAKVGQVGAKVQGPYPGGWQQLVSCYPAAQFSGETSSEMFGIKEGTYDN